MLKFKTLTAFAALGLSTAASAQVVLATSTWVPPTHLLSMSQAGWCADVASRARVD